MNLPPIAITITLQLPDWLEQVARAYLAHLAATAAPPPREAARAPAPIIRPATEFDDVPAFARTPTAPTTVLAPTPQPAPAPAAPPPPPPPAPAAVRPAPPPAPAVVRPAQPPQRVAPPELPPRAALQRETVPPPARPPMRTPERLAILLREIPRGTTTRRICDLMNELPGRPIDGPNLRHWAIENKLWPGSDQALIQQHLATKGVTRLPPAAADVTSATLPPDARAAIRAHEDALEQSRHQLLAAERRRRALKHRLAGPASRTTA